MLKTLYETVFVFLLAHERYKKKQHIKKWNNNKKHIVTL